jgi:hypothetical protein
MDHFYLHHSHSLPQPSQKIIKIQNADSPPERVTDRHNCHISREIEVIQIMLMLLLGKLARPGHPQSSSSLISDFSHHRGEKKIAMLIG